MNILDKFHHWRRKQRWNRQYKSGRWDSLENEIESARYLQIIEFLKTNTIPNPTILDIGCGHGVLNQRMLDSSYSYKSFTGLDFSKVSIEKAITKNYPDSKFLTADVITYQPDQKFDAIIFNEAFYYIHETEKSNVLERMLEHLNENGVLVNSIYREGLGCWEYFKEHPKLIEKGYTKVTTQVDKTYWHVGAYTKS